MNLDELLKSTYEEGRKQGYKDGLRAAQPVIENSDEATLALEVVCKYYKIPVEKLKTSSRKRDVTIPRMVCMAMMKQYSPLSYKQIGHFFGGRDHTTALHAHRTVADLRATDEGFEKQVAYIEQAVINLVINQEPVLIEPLKRVSNNRAMAINRKQLVKVDFSMLEAVSETVASEESTEWNRPAAQYSNRSPYGIASGNR